MAGVGLVHTLGGPGRHEDFSPRLYFTVPLRCILGGPHPTLGIDSEGSAVFRDTVFEAFRRLAPFSLPPDHFASHDDVGEAIVVHARDAAGVVEDTLTVVIFKSQIKKQYFLRLPDLEPPMISSNPGSLGFPGCALLALVRPVPPTLAPSLQRSRSVPWPVVLDVQSCTPLVLFRAGDVAALRQVRAQTN